MKYKTIINRSGKKIDLHICQTQDGSYIIGIPEGMKDNAEMFVEMYNSGGSNASNGYGNSFTFIINIPPHIYYIKIKKIHTFAI